MFKDALMQAMQQKGISGSDLSRMTGIGKASISQYIHGVCTPSAERMKQLEDALEVPLSADPKEGPDAPPAFRRAGVREVARAMGINEETLRKGIRQRVFPWAYGIKTSANRWVYVINRDQLEKIEGVSVGSAP
ncbi:MAG: helix-turn-helix domain-containing protein [Clostridiales bacterium]|nr:helix-turn-helix domain-containing protein [Clostridiales bacterium]